MSGTPLQATLSPDGAEVRLRQGAWSASFPVAHLGRWIALYRGLRDRKGGRYGWIYAGDVEALEAVAAEVAAGGGA